MEAAVTGGSFHRPQGRLNSLQPVPYALLSPSSTRACSSLSLTQLLQDKVVESSCHPSGGPAWLKGSLVMRESTPRQVDEKSGVPEEGERVWGSQEGGERTAFFYLYIP